jgi:hypothetical protein
MLFERSLRAPGMPYVTNDCICCAERKMIKKLELQASREGIRRDKFATWVHRKYGDMVVWRNLADGSPGLSLPCVICRKAIESKGIQWRAHLGHTWYTQETAPKSRPTHKQMTMLGFVSS